MTLQQLLGIQLPIIQAPMAGVMDHRLAAVVSNTGGLGSLPAALLSLEALRSELTLLKAQTANPFSVNFFCHQPATPDALREAAWRKALAPYYNELGLDVEAIPPGPLRAPFSAEAAELLAEFRPAVVSFHFGLPTPALLEQVKNCGAKVIASATTLAEALWLQEHGVDAIIAQGLEAGGHRGHFLSDDLTEQAGTFALLPRIVKTVDVPVIAAGGIADARGVRAAMALGASGVQVGSAYLLCPEALTSAVHRAALKSPAAGHTAVTNLFSGRPARAIVNRLVRELGPLSSLAPAFPMAVGALGPLRSCAESQGNGDFSPLWCGQNATGCREVGAAQLTQELAAGFAP
jgi:nitronate monooxygenase